MKRVYIKKDRVVSTFEYWLYHNLELYWGQDCLLSLVCSCLIFGHYLDDFQYETANFLVAHYYSLIVHIALQKMY